MSISLPSANWFAQSNGDSITKNIYSGSCDTDPNRGCLSKKTFNFKVYVDLGELNSLCLIAECFCRLPYSSDNKRINYTVHKIPFEEGSISEMEKWLNLQHDTI